MQRKIFIKLMFTISLFGYLGYKVDWLQAKDIIYNIHLLPFICSYLILLMSTIPLALRLHVLLQPTVLQFSLRRLVEIQFISQFYGMFLPSGVGLALVRWYKITQNLSGRRVFAVITIVEKVMLVLTLALCAGLPLLFVKDAAIQTLRSSLLPLIFFIIILSVLFFAILCHPWVYAKFSIFMQKIQNMFNAKRVGRILGAYEDLGLYVHKRHLLFLAFFYHLIFQLMIFPRFYLVFAALDIDLPPFTILWISMLVLLLLSLPITLGGLGIREAGFAWILVLYGFDQETGVVLGGLLSLQLFFTCGIGGILSFMELKSAGQDG